MKEQLGNTSEVTRNVLLSKVRNALRCAGDWLFVDEPGAAQEADQNAWLERAHGG